MKRSKTLQKKRAQFVKEFLSKAETTTLGVWELADNMLFVTERSVYNILKSTETMK